MNPSSKPKYISKAERAKFELEREAAVGNIEGGESSCHVKS